MLNTAKGNRKKPWKSWLIQQTFDYPDYPLKGNGSWIKPQTLGTFKMKQPLHKIFPLHVTISGIKIYKFGIYTQH